MLDLYGTNHNARTGKIQGRFGQSDFIRGMETHSILFLKADHRLGHRCPGEGITIELMDVALNFLAGRMGYTVPEQDLSINNSRLPALLRNGFIFNNVCLLS